jgi:hypothetical protein
MKVETERQLVHWINPSLIFSLSSIYKSFTCNSLMKLKGVVIRIK